MEALKDVLVFSLFFRIWSGRKKLRPEDLVVGGGLPPEQLVSLGSKKVFSPEDIKPFHEVKRRAETTCASKGVRFVKGFAIPKVRAEEVAKELKGLMKEFDEAKTSFLASYVEERERWGQQFPEYRHIIERDVLSRAQVATRLGCGFQVFSVNAPEGDVAEMAYGGTTGLQDSLSAQLFIEVAAAARDLVKRSLDGRAEVTQKFLRPLRAIKAKLECLAFLDAAVDPVIAEIDSVLGAMPRAGKIAGRDLAALRGVCALLSDPGRMRAHGGRVVAGETLADDEDEPIPVEGEDTEEPAEKPARVGAEEANEAEFSFLL